MIYDHLISRKLQIYRYSGVYIIEEEGLVVFSLWNLSGQMVGYQQYRPNATKEKMNHPREGRYYTSLHGDKNEKPLAVWGLETYNYRTDILFITEGIFDACRLHNFGFPAVALLSSDYKHFRNWLNSTGRKVISIPDDHASKLGPYQQLIIPQYRNDLSSCTDKEIYYMILNQLYLQTR